MLTITQESINNTTAIQKPEDIVAFLAPAFAKFMKGGKLHPLFNTVMAEGWHILDHDNYETPAKKSYALNKSLGHTKQALAIAAKRTIQCCGLPPEVRGGYDRKTGRHSLLVRCNYCGCSLHLEEQGARHYQPGMLNRQAVPELKKEARDKLTLRMARERSGYSETAAAKLIGIETNKLRELELDCGKIRLNMAERFCQLYHLSMDWIHWGREDSYSQKGGMSHA